MELRVLRYFLAVADTGSTIAAAEALRTSQPSLSRQVRQLERELAVELFDRSHRRPRLTAAGRRLVAIARDVTTRADDVVRLMAEGIDSAPITVVAPLTFIADVIAPFLAQPEAAGTIVYPREIPASDAMSALDVGDADVAISSWPVPDRYATRMLTRPPLWAYVHPGHRLARRHAVEVTELVREPLIVLSHDHGTRRLFDEAVAAANASYEPHLVTNLPIVAMALAA
ncbi:MAG TPA: LysR family transcriptional regulator, partial [Candidatus Saccharimonadales bacterium]|nr:LysR family transcriptional regulator [Candidatus Saccharimonadales bacterium]